MAKGENDSSQSSIRVAVDAMGGDYAPGEIIKGAVEGGPVRCR